MDKRKIIILYLHIFLYYNRDRNIIIKYLFYYTKLFIELQIRKINKYLYFNKKKILHFIKYNKYFDIKYNFILKS